VVFTIACGGGFAFLSSETRPEKQWVPAGQGWATVEMVAGCLGAFLGWKKQEQVLESL